MIEKEVKQYKRSKNSNSYTYRIDLTKKAGFNGGDKAIILNQDEYKKLIANNSNNETEIANIKKEHQKDTEKLTKKHQNIIDTLTKEHQINTESLIKNNEDLQNKYNESIAKYDETLNKFNNLIESNNQDIIKLTDKLNSYKDTIAGLNILVGKYKHRNLFDRLLNRPLNLNKEDQHLLTNEKE